jgi:hypothetical protein
LNLSEIIKYTRFCFFISLKSLCSTPKLHTASSCSTRSLGLCHGRARWKNRVSII